MLFTALWLCQCHRLILLITQPLLQLLAAILRETLNKHVPGDQIPIFIVLKHEA